MLNRRSLPAGCHATSGRIRCEPWPDAGEYALSPEEAHKMLFWNYHANGKQPETAAWNSGLHRYMTDEQAAQILRDIALLKQNTQDAELARRFFDKFCMLTKIDTNKLKTPQGALTL